MAIGWLVESYRIVGVASWTGRKLEPRNTRKWSNERSVDGRTERGTRR
jgi:hypothetical protein